MKNLIWLFLLLIVPIYPQEENGEQLYLSLNIEEGAKLQFSDGSTYEIDPDDRLYSAFWITPFPVELGKSENPKYPVKITNLNTLTSVNGKKISTKEVIKEAEKKRPKQKWKERLRQKPKPKSKTPKPSKNP